MSLSSVAVIALVLVCGSGLSSAQDPLCNTSCLYQQTVWSVILYDQAEVPESLWDNDVAGVLFDGDQDWYDAGCDRLNFEGRYFEGCEACIPRWVYLYRQQKRVLTSSGKKESVNFLDLAYAPSQGNWNDYCASDVLVAPDFSPEDDEHTFKIRSAHYVYASGPSCYDRVFCSTTQAVAPFETAGSCDSLQYNGYPSYNFCGYDPTAVNFPATLRLGCESGGCDTLTIDLPAFRKQNPSTWLRVNEQRRKKKYLTSCEYADSWYFNVKF